MSGFPVNFPKGAIHVGSPHWEEVNSLKRRCCEADSNADKGMGTQIWLASFMNDPYVHRAIHYPWRRVWNEGPLNSSDQIAGQEIYADESDWRHLAARQLLHLSLRFLGLILSFFRTHGTLLNVKYIEIRCLSRQNVYTVHPWTLFGIAPTSGLIDYHLLLFSLLTRACISIIKNAKFIKPRECQAIHTARPRLSSRF